MGFSLVYSDENVIQITRNIRDAVLNCLEEMILNEQKDGVIHYIQLSRIILQLRTTEFAIIEDGCVKTQMALGAFDERSKKFEGNP